jgi:cysteine desulfurase/selenocysteine lyase
VVTPLAPRADFPLLARTIEDRRIVYLDSASTTLKPQAVIDAVLRFYTHFTANIHRGNHSLSQETSEAYEQTRDAVARFLNAGAREIVFTANTTESLNLVGEGLALAPGDNVVSTMIEHHSNLLPWMQRCETRIAPVDDQGRVNVEALERLVDARTRLVAVGHVSNVTGAIAPLARIIELAHARGVPVAVDAAQSVPHLPVDVLALGCDFLAFSAHKMLGPSGVGVLYVAEAMWDRLRPLKLGGGTVDHVRTDGFDLKRVPHRFEAGTPNIEGVLGLGAAVAYLERIGMNAVARHDAQLAESLHRRLADVPGIRVLGPRDPREKIAVASIVPTGKIDVQLLGSTLSDSFKVMARAGTHCAHPYFGSEGMREGALRLSAYLYNDEQDLAEAARALGELMTRFGARR